MHITYHISHIAYRISYVTYHISHVTDRMSHVTCHMLYVTFHISHVTYLISNITYLISHITYLISYIMYHLLHTTFRRHYASTVERYKHTQTRPLPLSSSRPNIIYFIADISGLGFDLNHKEVYVHYLDKQCMITFKYVHTLVLK